MSTPDKDARLHEAWYEAKVNTPQELLEFLTHLSENYTHDYNTSVHALAAAAVATARMMDRWSKAGGITGYQGSHVMLQFIRHWMSIQGPFRVLQYRDMLYPQYDTKFEKTIPRWIWKDLQKEATDLLAKKDPLTVGRVGDHWKAIVDGVVPFGYTVVDGD